MMNEKYNRLTTISNSYFKQIGKYKRKFIKCKCICGKELEVRFDCLNKNTKSCGCLSIEQAKENIKQAIKSKITHKLSKHPLYKIWQGMKTRCYNDKYPLYHRYGGRGIIVEKEWKDNYLKFHTDCIKFWKPGLEIDRINNDGNYGPNNFRFVSCKINCNNRTDNTKITMFNETKTLAEWSRDKRCRVKYSVFLQRITISKWSPEKALITPARKINVKRKTV